MAVSPKPGFLDVIKHHRMFSCRHRTLGKEGMEGRPDTTDAPSTQSEEPVDKCRARVTDTAPPGWHFLVDVIRPAPKLSIPATE